MSAIDFKRMLAEERAKALRQSEPSSSGGTAREPGRADSSKLTPVLSCRFALDEAYTRPAIQAPEFRLPHFLDAGGVARGNVLYIPDFITPADEVSLLHDCIGIDATMPHWVQLKRRRLLCFGASEPTPPSAGWPEWCDQLGALVGEPQIGLPINHALVNEYHPGEGILAHQDGPNYVGRVCILSLSSPVCIHFLSRVPSIEDSTSAHMVAQLVLEPRSLLVFEDWFYTSVWHAIPEADTVALADSTSVLTNHSRLSGAYQKELKRTRKRVSITLRHKFPSCTETPQVRTPEGMS